MSRFDFLPTPIAGLKVVQRKALEDARGSLSRVFCGEAFADLGFQAPVAQINLTCTGHRGAVRGLHFQHPPHAEIKVVSCLKGRVWDVAVDLRAGSPTFLHWHAEELSSTNLRSLYIPEGFAHGYQTLEADCELLYLHSVPHHPEAEGALHVRDPRLALSWPLPIQDLSARDAGHPFLGPDFEGLRP